MKPCLNCGAEFQTANPKRRYCCRNCSAAASQRHLYSQRHATAAGTASTREKKTVRIDLGLAISAATLQPGKSRTCSEIARFCDCSKQAIDQIYNAGLTKLRRHLARAGVRPSHH